MPAVKMKYKNLSVLLVVAISVSATGYSSFAQLGLATPMIFSGHPSGIIDLDHGARAYKCNIDPHSCIILMTDPCNIYPWLCDPCILQPWLCHPGVPGQDRPGFPDPRILDLSNLRLNESLIVTQMGESTIVTKVPTEDILNQNTFAMLNRTHLAGNMTG